MSDSNNIISDTFFSSLHKIAVDNPDVIDIYIDENGDIDFEIDYDFFMKALEGMKGENDD